jgi:hypothetical protein
MTISHLSRFPALLAIALGTMTVGGGARAGQVWTVQAVAADKEIVCDAFAEGEARRPVYEFRFRRSATSLLLIISYTGAAIPHVRQAALSQDGAPLGTLPAVATRFGERNAIAISLEPGSVDFSQLERHRLLTAIVSGQSFEIGLLPEDRVADNMAACIEYAKAHQR